MNISKKNTENAYDSYIILGYESEISEKDKYSNKKRSNNVFE